MEMDMEKNNGVDFRFSEDTSEAVFSIRGELDHHSVKEIREAIDEKLIVHRPKRVIFNLSGVTFTDSAGLGLILGRYTRITGYKGELRLVETPKEFMKILRLAGADRMFKIEEKRKENEQ